MLKINMQTAYWTLLVELNYMTMVNVISAYPPRLKEVIRYGDSV